MMAGDIDAWNEKPELTCQCSNCGKTIVCASLDDVDRSICTPCAYALDALYKTHMSERKKEMPKPQMVELAKPERARTYVYPDETSMTFKDVTHVAVSTSGTHRLNLQDGRKVIVPTGWRYIVLDMDDWTF